MKKLQYSMISKEVLKQKLLETGNYIDNFSINQYIELMIKNLNTSAEKNLTQKHHIIPRHYYQHKNIPIDNSKENLINLPIYDHIRAHYYLYKCSKLPEEQYSNLYALRRMIGGKFSNLSEIENLNDDECAQLYLDYNEGNRKAHLGKTHITSDETKNKISLSNKDKYHDYKAIHNDEGTEKRVPESELQYYLDGGWILGRSEKSINSLKQNYNYDSKGMLGKHQSDYQKESARKALLGKAKSDESRANMSKARLGKYLYINPETGKGKYLSPEEIEEYTKLGWYKK